MLCWHVRRIYRPGEVEVLTCCSLTSINKAQKGALFLTFQAKHNARCFIFIVQHLALVL